MAKEQPKTNNDSKPPHTKLPRLPKDARITKRPLLHPPIASPLTGSHVPKTVYIRSTTPFVSAIKRVRTYLSAIDARSMGPIDLSSSSLTDRDLVASTGKGREGKQEEVTVKATGRAIERALEVGLWFMKQEDCMVVLRTGTVGAVDDVVVGGEESARVRRAPVLEVGICLK